MPHKKSQEAKEKKSQRCSIEIEYREYEPSITTITCLESCKYTEAYGSQSPSRRRALAELTEICPCGVKWHYVADEDLP